MADKEAIEFSIEVDSPVKPDIKFWSVVGHEALSRPSFYELTVLTKKPRLDPKDILGKAFSVKVEFVGKDGTPHKRYFNGHAVRLVRGEKVGAYCEYHISLRSWFWLLTRRINSRIFQDDDIIQVIDKVMEDSPIKKIVKLNKDHINKEAHKPLRYCVQQTESDYTFISRLFENEGTYYWFDAHDPAGTMWLSDSSDAAHEPLPAIGTLPFVKDGVSTGEFNEIARWVTSNKLDTGKHASADYNHKKAHIKLGIAIDAAEDHELGDFEEFDYPPNYFSPEAAESVAKMRGDEIAARRNHHCVVTGWPDVAVGRQFTFPGAYDQHEQGDYLIASCTFVMSHSGYPDTNISAKTKGSSILKRLHSALNDDAITVQTLDAIEDIVETTPALRSGLRGSSSFLLTVLPAKQAYRPARVTPRVTMRGPQSAIVVGPAGEEIHVDEYGRVKVQFYWDRYGTNDEKSTAWVRVSQPWAGKGWGGYFVPRIGQEVIVDFLNGDPDSPVIIGRVYNSDNKIPFKSGTQSGFKTRSTPHGNASNYNEIMFEDRKGSEIVSIHAERNMSTSVEVDDSISVGHDQSVSVGNHQTIKVKFLRSVTVEDGDEKYEIKGTRNTKIKTDDNLDVIKHKKTTVGAGNETQVTGEHKLVVIGDNKISVSGLEQHAVGGKITQTSKTLEVGTVADTTISAGGKLGNFSTGAMSIATDATLGVFSKGDLNVGSGTANIGLSAPAGNIDLMAMKINSCATGPSKLYTNAAKTTFALGIYAKNVIALYQENFLGLQNKNALGITLENKIGLNLTNVTFKFENNMLSLEKQAIKSLATGAADGGGGGALSNLLAKITGEQVRFLGALGVSAGIHVAAIVGISDRLDEAQAEKDAAKDAEDHTVALARARKSMADLAAEASAVNRPELAARLKALSDNTTPSKTAVVIPLGAPKSVNIDDNTSINR